MPEEFKESIEIEVKAGQSLVLDLTAKKKDSIPEPVTLSENGALRVLLATPQSLFDTTAHKIYLKNADQVLEKETTDGKALFEELVPGEYDIYVADPSTVQQPDYQTVKKVTIKKGTQVNVPMQLKDGVITKIGVYPRSGSMGWSRMYMHLWEQAGKEGKTTLNDKERWVLQACDAISHRYRILKRSKKEADKERAANLRVTPAVICYEDLKAMVSLKSSSFIDFNKDLRDFKHNDEWFYTNNKYKQYFPLPKDLTKEVFDGWWKDSFNTKIKDGFLEEAYEEVEIKPTTQQDSEIVLRIVDDFLEPMSGQYYELLVSGQPLKTGFTDDLGIIKESVPKEFTSELFFDGELYELVGDNELEAISTLKGIQGRLNNLGYNAGPVDGIMGNHTSQAIREFQKNNSLSTSGLVDDSTRAELAKQYDNEVINELPFLEATTMTEEVIEIDNIYIPCLPKETLNSNPDLAPGDDELCTKEEEEIQI